VERLLEKELVSGDCREKGGTERLCRESLQLAGTSARARTLTHKTLVNYLHSIYYLTSLLM